MKDDPDHGFRVCVNALINKCLKPYASTVPLATDEIKKLYGYNYYLQVDGFSAYWSIPVCEESKRLTAFHTPDGIYCWNRLMMGAVPSSAVQQTAYLEALDQYIDYDEHDNLRQCLLDKNGERLKDKEGNPKTLRHRFAIYCDDIAAGADTLEELYELLEALICCCHRAGIQIKAGKLKFGVPRVVFHNYTISKEGTEPKEANICAFVNMQEPRDVHQLRAFLGCCQQLNQYIKDYGIIAKPLHNITKKGVKGPPPWIKGSDYDNAFHKLKAIIKNTKLYLHHKDALRRLFLEVDASDVGWGACAYQMLIPYIGELCDEGRMRIGDTGPRQIIQWISKAWTAHELTLPVFYRESLARILALEKFRNLIETNIEAGITLYTDHKPALFENSLSNKGQLSAWKLAEVADLLSIVENLYRQGGKMLFADPLSRVCEPTEGWYDPSLPRKLAALFDHLPDNVRNNDNVRVYAGKDTYAAGRLVQKWRKPSNPISKGKLLTKELAPGTFHIGIDDVNKSVNEVVKLISENKSFAVLMPISVTSEIARLENDKNGDRCHDLELAKKVSGMSKITLASSAEVWLINLPGEPFNHFYSNDMEGVGLTGVQEIFLTSYEEMRNQSRVILREHDNDEPECPEIMESFPITRSKRIINQDKDSPERNESEAINTPAGKTIVSGDRHSDEQGMSSVAPVHEHGTIKWTNVPRQPIPQLDDINLWVGHQLNHKRMPKEYQHMPPEGELVASLDGYPEGLLAVPNEDGYPRIIVPRSQIRALVLQCHEDIHHQSHIKVLYILQPLYYWPGMNISIERLCTACQTCITASVRRKHLKAKFDPNAPPSTMLPRQDYGIDFYGVYKGEILVMVDLFTREAILTHLKTRTQDNVAKTIIRYIIFQRGVPRSLRTDNAPELSSLTGAVSAICEYLKIDQIRTGGHNPRGNSICERVNQSIGSMIRKLSDQEYKQLREIALPAFQFAINTTFNSAIGCTPFEAGHGLAATTIAQARLQATRYATNAEGGRDGDTLEDVDQFFDRSVIKEQLELSVRMAEVVRATSEWHRRMTSENLSQSGHAVNLDNYPIGKEAYLYKPPSMAETIARGRRAKHIDHYIGPGIITKHIGTRSMSIRLNGRDFQRDAGMIMLEKPIIADEDPAIRDRMITKTHKHNNTSRITHPLQEGEFVIIKDDPDAKDWYCAEIRKILADRIEVNYYTTITPAIIDYKNATLKDREKNIKLATFLRTWCLDKGTGLPTTTPPSANHGKLHHLWWGRIPMEDVDKHILVRALGLSALGKFDKTTIKLAAQLDNPHHEGAGGVDDFVDKETFQKHVKRVSNRNKRKR